MFINKINRKTKLLQSQKTNAPILDLKPSHQVNLFSSKLKVWINTSSIKYIKKHEKRVWQNPKPFHFLFLCPNGKWNGPLEKHSGNWQIWSDSLHNLSHVRQSFRPCGFNCLLLRNGNMLLEFPATKPQGTVTRYSGFCPVTSERAFWWVGHSLLTRCPSGSRRSLWIM